MEGLFPPVPCSAAFSVSNIHREGGNISRCSDIAGSCDTVATLFIADFDSFMYGAFLAGTTTHQLLGTTDPVQVDMPNRHRVIAFIGANIISPLVTIALTVTLVFTMRRSCSGDTVGSGGTLVNTTALPASAGENSPLEDLSAIFSLW